MGLLDNLMSNVLGGATGGGTSTTQDQLMHAALGLIQQNGGIAGVLQKFQQSGLGQHAESWVSNGANLPITADQLHQVLGSGAVSGIAAQLGVDPSQISAGLAQALPQLINHLTPNGSVPENHADLVSEGLALLKGAMASRAG